MFKGEAELFISREKLRAMGWETNYQKNIDITGSVKEKLTGISFEASPVNFKTFSKMYKIDKLYTPKITRPGLKYTAYVSL